MRTRKILRVRTALYSVGLVAAFTAFLFFLGNRKDTLVDFLRASNTPFMQHEDGSISNLIRMRIENRAEATRTYTITPLREDFSTVPDVLTYEVEAADQIQLGFTVKVDPSVFVDGRADLELRVSDGEGFEEVFERRLLGPR